ncbi:unnamed protein product [Mytilus coruscus]|uniref:Uncharacterized protein n=1 Tax=Mytilus coruscus TaxID=42192 RepID=A0A6J8BQV3_MYTCO|nr:unnamed protein product [Mytilus coruscus]
MKTAKVVKRKHSKELDYKPGNGKGIQTHPSFGTNKKIFKNDLESESTCIQELKYPSGAFPSVYFTQVSLRQDRAFNQLSNPLDNDLEKFKNSSSLLNSIMEQPKVVIIRYGSQTESLPDLDFVHKGHHEEIQKYEDGYIYLDDDISNTCTPYVVVFVVRTIDSDGKRRLSRQTRFLLQRVRDKMKTITEDSVFIIQNTRYTERYSPNELIEIATEIEDVLQRNSKSSFKNVFHENEVELFVRLGLIMQRHMLNGMERLFQMLKNLKTTGPNSTESTKQVALPDKPSSKVPHQQEDDHLSHYNLSQFMAKLKKEINQRNHCLELHTLRILCHRNALVHSFGFDDGTVKVYLNYAEDEKAVKKYFQLYMKTRVLKLTFHSGPFELRGRKLSYEQGSRIDISHSPIFEKINYGTLGIFLKNKRRELFFTTCAHVIGNELKAYCSNDHSVLGKSVFACERLSRQSNQWLDLSLVKVCQDKVFTCRQGLKGTDSSDTFSEYKIFPGSIEDLIGRSVYKWGATTNYTEGKFSKFISSKDGFLQIGIESPTNFATEGDSGSLICLKIGEQDSDDRYAALVIWGGPNMTNETTKNLFNCYYISDALEEIRASFSKGEDMQMSALTDNPIPISSSPIYACSSNFDTRNVSSTD